MFSNNIHYLRKKHNLSQQALADILDIPRTTWSGYELGKTEPNLEMLLKLSEHFNVNLDALLKKDLSHEELELVRNKDLRVLAVTVDSEQRQNIELVQAKAEAGYLESFQDPEFIRELPKMSMPQMPQGSYRAFEIRGDSMLPLQPGSVVICQYLEKLSDLKSGKTYVIASTREGLVYKRINIDKTGNALVAFSDNPGYPPYRIEYQDIAEIWQYYAHISFADPKDTLDDWLEKNFQSVHQKLDELKGIVEGR